MKNKKIFIRIFAFVLLFSFSFLSSCQNQGDEVVFSYEDKIVTKAMYEAFYEKNKESLVSQFKTVYEEYSYYPQLYYAQYGFLPDGTDEYWETDFWDVTIPDFGTTAGEYLDQSTIRACKEYIVYEKIASDNNFSALPDEVISEFETLKNDSISTYGSYAAWDIATICNYGITAEELMDFSIVSSYGLVLPEYIFDFTEDEVVDKLSDSVQFKYYVYEFGDEQQVTSENDDEGSSESTSGESSDEYYKELMYSKYKEVSSGEKEFDDIYSEILQETEDADGIFYSSSYQYSNGVLLKKSDFESYLNIDDISYNAGEVYFAENEVGFFLIQISDFTSDYIELKRESMVDASFSTLVESYFEDIEVNQELLSVLTKFTDD